MPTPRLATWFGLLILVSVAGASLVDWQFWSRYLTRPQSATDLSVDWYQPQVPVAGDYKPLPRRLDGTEENFGEAVAIAEEYNSRALLIAQGDEIILERYWGGADTTTPHLTFSFHKTVSALLVGTAIADGHVGSIDASIGDYIKEWANDPRGKPSLRSAMQMSAGYAQPSLAGGPFSEWARFAFSSDIVSATLAGGLDEMPGPQFDYSDRTAQIVGLALQEALPQSYQTYLSERLWQRIHARDAAVVKADEEGPVTTYCCLMATAEDWLKIGMLLRDRGLSGSDQIVPSAWIDQMSRPAATNANFGLFLWLGSPFTPERTYTSASPASVKSRTPFLVDGVIFLDGAGGQRIYISRELDLVVVRLGEYRPDWDDTRLFNAVAMRTPEFTNRMEK